MIIVVCTLQQSCGINTAVVAAPYINELQAGSGHTVTGTGSFSSLSVELLAHFGCTAATYRSAAANVHSPWSCVIATPLFVIGFITWEQR